MEPLSPFRTSPLRTRPSSELTLLRTLPLSGPTRYQNLPAQNPSPSEPSPIRTSPLGPLPPEPHPHPSQDPSPPSALASLSGPLPPPQNPPPLKICQHPPLFRPPARWPSKPWLWQPLLTGWLGFPGSCLKQHLPCKTLWPRPQGSPGTLAPPTYPAP